MTTPVSMPLVQSVIWIQTSDGRTLSSSTV